MTERGQRTRKNNKFVGYVAAIVVHAVIIGAVFIKFTSDDAETVEAAYAEKVDVVRATTIEESQIQQQQDLIKEQERDKQRQKELEQKKLEDLQAKAEQEKQNIEDLKKEQEQEKDKALELEKQREALALKRKEEDEKREEELAERKVETERQEKLADEKKRQEQVAQKERDDEEAARQRVLQESLAAEESFMADQISKERTTTLAQKHLALIGNRIKAVRRLTPDIESWRKTKVNIKASPSGEVESVRTIESSGSLQYDRLVETAVYKASPLPVPDASAEPETNKRFWDFNFIVKVLD